MIRILLVEDESKVARAVQDGLEARGYEVTLAATGDAGLQAANTQNVDLVVLDPPSRGTPLDNVIDVHIMRLRRKVDPDASARLIRTVRGVGFVVREGEP